MKVNKIIDYKGLKIGKPTVEKATDEELQETIANFLEGSAEVVEKDGALENGDTANIDFEGFLDGTPFDGGKGEGYDLVLGSGTFIPGFEDQLIGHKKGEDVDVNVTFPENYQAENLKGKAVVFKCKVNAVKVKRVPAFDDELAKKCNLSTKEELKEALAEQIYVQKSNKAYNEYLMKVWDKLVEGSDIEVDDEDVNENLEKMLAYYAQSMAQYGATMDQYLQMTGQTMDQFKEQIKPEAVKTKKIDIINEYIIEKEGIVVEEKDVEDEIQKIKAYYGLQDEEVENLRKENAAEVKKEIIKTKVSTMLLKNND